MNFLTDRLYNTNKFEVINRLQNSLYLIYSGQKFLLLVVINDITTLNSKIRF